MSVDETANHVELVRTEAVIPGERERLKPELARLVLAFDVNVRGFVAVEAGEEEPVWPQDVLDSRHSKGIPRSPFVMVMDQDITERDGVPPGAA